MNKTFIKLALSVTLISATLVVNNTNYEANELNKGNVEGLYENKEFDVSQGWEVDFTSSIPNIHHEDIFKQNVKSPTTPQKMVINNFANIGNAELTAKKIIPMKKGHTYKLNLIYAMKFTNSGTAYIDFNGEKKTSDSVNNDAVDHVYEKTISPTQDEEYVITMYFKVPFKSNGYLKLGYDTSLGGGIEEHSDLAAPILVAPFEGRNFIEGTGIIGNKIEIYDANKQLLGSGRINAQGKFNITVNRSFIAGEEIYGYQIDKNGVISERATTIVKEYKKPNQPILDKVTDESKSVTGKSDPNIDIIVTIGEEVYTVTSDKEGNFFVPFDYTYPYGTEIHAVARNQEGFESDVANAVVQYAKPISIDFDNKLSSIDTLISGTTTRPNTQVEIRVGARLFLTQTDGDGRYMLQLQKTYLPGTEVSAKITDKAGETAEKKQVILPRIPTFNTIISGVTEIYGITDPNAVVTIQIEKKSGEIYEFKSIADIAGNYYVELKDGSAKIPLEVGDILSAWSTIEEINLSSEKADITVLSLR
ncbi:hypothetical protein UAW_02486 [Enterococcus haemoperoxidus ATCC BAA-382]|uniref:Bacterial Ig domain-containing protein n=1 Tax=Enterococcus haemoperoxidus ATCC BAA-382 TaxID=1158608 RepID=R2SL19_9ENTE|nr:Ig-like domain-containing protein [Enterococcus haemoperoxidus]EOH93536.1 hypothetical protein UAW_02486 [Enterococcus haemoperoxidus ATCC BAA-382]EOT63371.1 hypothetical protein I583_00171 [Enterococcus haemoperoxidus ATCC BAA-382]OJG51450.1 hypothetical protein RV06_GL001631 [Enterococcus haemoperoxidus]